MGIKNYFFINGLPLYEFIGTLFFTLLTYYSGKALKGTTGAVYFNFVPFLVITIACWLYCIIKIYVFLRIYLSGEPLVGEVLGVNNGDIKIGYRDIAYNNVIKVKDVHSRYASMLKKGMRIRCKTYGRWAEILNTNKSYLAYMQNIQYKPYMLIERLSKEFFAYLDSKYLI